MEPDNRPMARNGEDKEEEKREINNRKKKLGGIRTMPFILGKFPS